MDDVKQKEERRENTNKEELQASHNRKNNLNSGLILAPHLCCGGDSFLHKISHRYFPGDHGKSEVDSRESKVEIEKYYEVEMMDTQ